MDKSDCIKAVTALQEYLTKENLKKSESNNLLDDDQEISSSRYLQLIITTKKFISDHRILKPKVVRIPHPFFETEAEVEEESNKFRKPTICLFVKDPQRTYKDSLQGDESPTKESITRVIGVSKLKGKFKPYEAKRQLVGGYDLFLADDRVVTTLPKLLGKIFYSSVSTIPIPLSIVDSEAKKPSSTKVKTFIDKLLHSTWFTLDASNMLVVRVGLDGFKPEQVAENVESVIEYVTKNVVKNGLEGIRAVHIKSSASPSLPIYLAEKIYGEDDIQEEAERLAEEENKKRKREEERKEPKLNKLDEALAEVVDEEEFEEYTKSKYRNKKKTKQENGKPEEGKEKKAKKSKADK